MYKVKALSVGLPGNVIKHSGDIINEGQLKPELAENLVRQGFLEKLPIFEEPIEVGPVNKISKPVNIKNLPKFDEKMEIGEPMKFDEPIKVVKKTKIKKDIEPLNDELID
jgi:hypothetical protein